jgi:hypothetical protein
MRPRVWYGPLLLAVFFAALAAWSWEKWADVHIDFGAELYTAWRLAEGDALYRDIAYRQGPLPHYLNALWFTLFGVSIRVLALCNLALLAAICALSWTVFRRGCGAWVATATTAVLLGVFAFGQYVPIANYNFVTPYHHAQTHGLALCLAMIVAFQAAWRQPGRRGLAGYALAGLCVGGAFLTKAEIFVPAAAGALLAAWISAQVEAEAWLRALGAFAAGAVTLPLTFLLLLGARMPLPLAIEGVLGNWSHLGAGILADAFYLRGAGLDAPVENSLVAGFSFLCVGAFAAAVLGLDRLLPSGRARLSIALGAGAALFALLMVWPRLVPWQSLARALPLVAASVAVALMLSLWQARTDVSLLARRGPLAVYAVVALGLLGKMLLNARFEHYGFALAMPATLLLVAALYGLAGAVRGRGLLATSLVTAVVAAGVVSLLGRANDFYRRKDFAVGQGADRIVSFSPYTSPRPQRMAQALEKLGALMPAQSTLVVLPEGASLNYWLRKRNPSGFLLYLPTEIAAFGEARMLAGLSASPPDFVALVHRLSEEFGTGPFGVDPRNGRALVEWVKRHYERVGRVGSEPFGRGGFGVVMLRRRPIGAADAAAPRMGSDSPRDGIDSQGDAIDSLP